MIWQLETKELVFKFILFTDQKLVINWSKL